MKSKFSIIAWMLILFVIPLLLFGTFGYINFGIIRAKHLPPLNGIPLLVLLSLTYFWVIFGVIKTQIIVVIINQEFINVKSFAGLGKSINYPFSSIDGYKTSFVHSAANNNEYLYLYQKGRKICKISGIYYKNYSELKGLIKLKSIDLGNENYNIFIDLKELFYQKSK